MSAPSQRPQAMPPMWAVKATILTPLVAFVLTLAWSFVGLRRATCVHC
jgi:hypothetical protein